MEERESSVASSTDFYESDKKPATPAREPPSQSAAKRKADEQQQPSPEKRRKLEAPSPSLSTELRPCAALPPAVWQRVFLFCSLPDLGRLLQVNRSFHSYLTDVRNVSVSKPDSGSLRLLKSDSIWASARNALPVKPPKPLPGFSEVRMWQLAWAKGCQFCKKLGPSAAGEKIWQQGPGAEGVRIIWPFGIRTCGPCLMQNCQSDSSLLFSTASALRPALSFAFITNDQHYIPAYMLQAATTPAGVEIAKYFSKEHVEGIIKELNEAMQLGQAAAEEWSKGLEARGRERMKVAENWERWEVKYQWWSDHHAHKRAASGAPSPAPTCHKEPSRSPTRQIASPIIHAPVPASKYPSAISIAARDGSLHPRFNKTPPVPSLTAAAPTPQIAPKPFTPGFTPQTAPTGSAQSAHRNLHDANEAKASRKADIERRCQQLDPPIQPNVLRHMDSFKAAIQIPQPMTDYAWSVLQPRLIAQLPAAQQAEVDHVSRAATLPSRATDRRYQDVNSKEVKEVMDREWEESQRPIRDRLSAIADDFINQDWDHGRAVTYENSPKFAVDLLVYVRRIFYAEAQVPEETAESSATEEADKKPKLVLENMKWVYDNKLKPLTEQFRKELFLCYGTGCEGNTRFYGFEGVIQHFGAKHTNAFSVGNVVVAWREAEWPEETPFHPDPTSVKHAFYPASSAAGQSGYSGYYGGYSRAGTTTPHMQSHLPQASPGPYYGGHYNGPFAPPIAPTYDYSQSYGAPAESYSYQPMGPPGFGPQAPNNGYVTSPAMTNAAVAPPPPMPPPGQDANEAATQAQSEDADHSTHFFDKQVSTIIDMAQDIWKQFSGIKDLPNSLRIYVLLHRIILKFHIEFNHEPNLNHFIDALSNHDIPKALKNAPGLSCKACQDEVSHQSTAAYSRLEERKTYTVLNLFSHFKSQHSVPQPSAYGSAPPSSLDWKEDMIELPSDRFISGLIHAPGMDDEKLHMIATVFPRLFPTPLPRIGVVDSNGAASPVPSGSKDSKDGPRAVETPGVTAEKSGPSSLASPYTESPRPPRPNDDEYDPQRPALSAQATQASRLTNRKQSYRGSPPLDRRSRYYADPRYYLSREPLDDDYSGPREYLDYAPSSRRFHEPGLVYEDYPGRRPMYRDQEAYYGPGPDQVIYAHPRDGVHPDEYGSYPRQVRYYEDEGRRPDYRYVREPKSRDTSPSRGQSAADRFLDDLGQELPATTAPAPPDATVPLEAKPAADADDDGSRYTPPPPNVPAADDSIEQPRPNRLAHPTAPSTVSNGSRYEEYHPGSRQIPTPDSAGPPRRAGPHRVGPHRRRDRLHDHVPSRYYRYMSVARDDPYGRAASMNRSQSRRYERYEEQRRRIDQQETPQPTAERDYDLTYSRDQSVDQPQQDEASYFQQLRHAPREYIPLQDRHQFSPPRYRYAGPHHPEDSRGAGPPQHIYVDEFGHPVHEYEYIRVPREHRQPRGQYVAYPPQSHYLERGDPEHFQYVPVPYDRHPASRYEARPREYVYYEERERERAPPSARRPPVEAESEPFEPPPPPPPLPEIKVESAPVGMPEGP